MQKFIPFKKKLKYLNLGGSSPWLKKNAGVLTPATLPLATPLSTATRTAARDGVPS